MTLRQKTLCCLALSLLVFLIGAGMMAHRVMHRRFAALEHDQVTRDLIRARNALHTELLNLERLSLDWSLWDDSYRFIDSLSPVFIETNLPDSTFENLHLNVMLFYDSEARLVYGKAFDLEQKAEIPLPDPLLTQLRKTARQLLTGPIKTGILLFPGQPMLLTCQPILTSHGTGPVKGTLIMGRNLEAGEIDHLSNIAQVQLSIYPADGAMLPDELRRHLDAGRSDPLLLVLPTSTERMDGYALLADIYGAPAVVLQIRDNRAITANSDDSIHSLLAIFALTGVGLAVVVLWMVDRLITARLARLGWELQRIGESGDFSRRITVTGRDELSRMAEDVNRMLGSLEMSHQSTHEQEQLYRAVMEQATDAIALVDGESKQLLKANSVFQKMLGCDERNISGLTLYDVLMEGPDSIDRETEAIARSGKAALGVKLLRGRDARMLEVEFSASPVSLAGKQVICVVGHNITELKQVEKALRSQLHFVKSLIDAIPCPIFYKDVREVYLGGNRAFEAFFGRSMDELVGKTAFDLVPMVDAEFYHQADKQLLQQGPAGIQRYEATVSATNGQARQVVFHKANFTDAEGRLAGLIGTIIDITQNKTIEAELDRERRQLFDLLDNLPAIIYVVAADYSIPFANRRFREVFGPPEQTPCFELLNGCEPSCHKQPAERCGALEKIARGEAMVVDRYYHGHRYQVRKYPFTEADGTLRMLVMATPRDTAGGNAEPDEAPGGHVPFVAGDR